MIVNAEDHDGGSAILLFTIPAVRLCTPRSRDGFRVKGSMRDGHSLDFGNARRRIDITRAHHDLIQRPRIDARFRLEFIDFRIDLCELGAVAGEYVG